jgi:hypothetical protein
MVRYFGTQIQLPADPASAMQVGTKQYIDAGDLDARRAFDYPLDQYGLVAASIHPDSVGSLTANGVSINTIEIYRIYVPANKAITGACCYIGTAGATPGVANDSGFCLYPDDGSAQTAKTVNDYTLFTSTGWRPKAFPSPVAAQAVGRFVRLAMLHTCTVVPKFATSAVTASGTFYNGIVPSGTHKRGVFATTTTTFPASFTPSTFGTNDGPMLFLGLY